MQWTALTFDDTKRNRDNEQTGRALVLSVRRLVKSSRCPLKNAIPTIPLVGLLAAIIYHPIFYHQFTFACHIALFIFETVLNQLLTGEQPASSLSPWPPTKGMLCKTVGTFSTISHSNELIENIHSDTISLLAGLLCLSCSSQLILANHELLLHHRYDFLHCNLFFVA